MVHLLTYATPRFRLRQSLLGTSARWNRVADSVTAWTPERLERSGFPEAAPDLRLSERGSGFWAWKPFIIHKKLSEVPDGDIVLYCDVGRLYPFKLIDQPLAPYLAWMDGMGQDVMPGILIPWDGSVLAWTRRSVLQELGMDRPEIHSASPVQASFSVWRASSGSRSFANRWMKLCGERRLVSDDPGPPGIAEHPGFRAHRHDQALLTLCCLRDGIRPLEVGKQQPGYDSRHPSMVSRDFAGEVPGYPRPGGYALRFIAGSIGFIEGRIRSFVKFGKPIHE